MTCIAFQFPSISRFLLSVLQLASDDNACALVWYVSIGWTCVDRYSDARNIELLQ